MVDRGGNLAGDRRGIPVHGLSGLQTQNEGLGYLVVIEAVDPDASEAISERLNLARFAFHFSIATARVLEQHGRDRRRLSIQDRGELFSGLIRLQS